MAHDLFDRVGGRPEDLTGPLVTEAARDGDPLARRAARRDRPSGSASASPTWPRPSTPARFVIGGGSAPPATCCSDPAREAFRRQLTGRGYRPEATIVAAQLGNEAGLVGAADLARLGQ